MGNWNINIQGVGCHHNADNPTDADKMAKKFVADLKAAGHAVEGATITFGGRNDLLTSDPVAVTIDVDGRSVAVAHQVLSGGEILALSGVGSNYALMREDGESIGFDQRIGIVAGMRFSTVPPATF